MKSQHFLFALGLLFIVNLNAQDGVPRGPYNIRDGAVIDGVVIKDEVPIRSKIEYEHVRLADYVWSKRVFSRIDSREKMNHYLFMPYDNFLDGWDAPSTVDEIDKKDWVKHDDRLSLWTIIFRHVMLGDLTVYEVSGKDFTALEDGYSFKYPINKPSRDAYFTNSAYRKEINKKLSFGGPGELWKIEGDDENATPTILMRDDENESFEDWFTRVTTKGLAPDFDPEYFGALTRLDEKNKNNLKNQYEATKAGISIKFPDVIKYISSQSITAFNIKEDWFFDKERSMLDRRIIAIAPVGRVKPLEKGEEASAAEVTDDGINRFKNFVSMNRNGYLEHCNDGKFEQYDGAVQEKELFWLYFPELRDVIVNYYVYSDQSDAQWMSFDDVFWKRRFTCTIYKASDKFDREIQDYKYGVDALYQAEKIKDDIRRWEHDVWNY
jgi:hypothetical protein